MYVYLYTQELKSLAKPAAKGIQSKDFFSQNKQLPLQSIVFIISLYLFELFLNQSAYKVHLKCEQAVTRVSFALEKVSSTSCVPWIKQG